TSTRWGHGPGTRWSSMARTSSSVSWLVMRLNSGISAYLSLRVFADRWASGSSGTSTSSRGPCARFRAARAGSRRGKGATEPQQPPAETPPALWARGGGDYWGVSEALAELLAAIGSE